MSSPTSGEEFRKKFCSIEGSQKQVVSVTLKWKKFETTRTLPRAGHLFKLSNWWRRALVSVVPKNLMVTLLELHDHICRWEKSTEGQTSLQHSTDLGFMAVWQDSILSSGKTHENTLGMCKKHLKDPQTLRNKILWSDESQFQTSCLKETSSAHYLQSTIPKVRCDGSSLMLWGCFSAVVTERLVRVEENLKGVVDWFFSRLDCVYGVQSSMCSCSFF